MKTPKQIIDELIQREGGYVDHPADRGGPTRYGITQATARAYGYAGDMRALPVELARQIYMEFYYSGPRFDRVATLSPAIAEELMDTGVNMGQIVAIQFLQKWLNALNREGKTYRDMKVDGFIGPQTLAALDAYLKARGKEGETVMLRALNSSQAERYRIIAEVRPSQEIFLFGWLLNRVVV